eukprot:m51a1_g5567 hypothetical protein (414) ;mRNA; r:597023-598324
MLGAARLLLCSAVVVACVWAGSPAVPLAQLASGVPSHFPTGAVHPGVLSAPAAGTLVTDRAGAPIVAAALYAGIGKVFAAAHESFITGDRGPALLANVVAWALDGATSLNCFVQTNKTWWRGVAGCRVDSRDVWATPQSLDGPATLLVSRSEDLFVAGDAAATATRIGYVASFLGRGGAVVLSGDARAWQLSGLAVADHPANLLLASVAGVSFTATAASLPDGFGYLYTEQLPSGGSSSRRQFDPAADALLLSIATVDPGLLKQTLGAVQGLVNCTVISVDVGANSTEVLVTVVTDSDYDTLVAVVDSGGIPGLVTVVVVPLPRISSSSSTDQPARSSQELSGSGEQALSGRSTKPLLAVPLAVGITGAAVLCAGIAAVVLAVRRRRRHADQQSLDSLRTGTDLSGSNPSISC